MPTRHRQELSESVTVEHLRAAFNEVNQSHRQPLKDYAIIFKGKAYSPPQVAKIAHRYATDEEPEYMRVGIGTKTFDILENRGFCPIPISDQAKSKMEMDNAQRMTPPNSTEREGLVKSRVGQGYYRNKLINKFKGRCAITGCGMQEVLIASHILPWSESDEFQRLDVNNGILLSLIYDAFFDQRLISFSVDGQIIISDAVSAQCRSQLRVDENAVMSIPVSEEMEFYLSRHREKI